MNLMNEVEKIKQKYNVHEAGVTNDAFANFGISRDIKILTELSQKYTEDNNIKIILSKLKNDRVEYDLKEVQKAQKDLAY